MNSYISLETALTLFTSSYFFSLTILLALSNVAIAIIETIEQANNCN